MPDEKELKYSIGLFNDYRVACYIIYITERGRRKGEVCRIHGQDNATKAKARKILNIMNQVKIMNVREDIEPQFRKGYLEREKDFTKEETDLFYSFDLDDPRQESARLAVLSKRNLFYSMWLMEPDEQHFQDEEKVKGKYKKKSVWTIIKDYFDLRK